MAVAVVRDDPGDGATRREREPGATARGRFGTHHVADMPTRAAWTSAVRSHIEHRLGCGWAYWDFCTGFGAYDANTGIWRAPLLAALLD